MGWCPPTPPHFFMFARLAKSGTRDDGNLISGAQWLPTRHLMINGHAGLCKCGLWKRSRKRSADVLRAGQQRNTEGMMATQLQTILALKEQGVSVPEIAERVGINVSAVYSRLWKINNLEKHREMQRNLYRRSPAFGKPRKFWSEDEDKILRDCLARKMSAGLIATGLGRTRNMVIGRAHRLGIGIGCHPEIVAPHRYNHAGADK